MLLLAGAVAALSLTPQSLQAGEPVRSPKLQQWVDQNRRTTGVTDLDMIDRSVKGKSPKLIAQEREQRRGTEHTVDRIARGPTGSIPRLLANQNPASRPWGERFMLAPVK